MHRLLNPLSSKPSGASTMVPSRACAPLPFSGVAKDGPGKFEIFTVKDRVILIEQSNILLKQSVSQVVPYQLTESCYATWVSLLVLKTSNICYVMGILYAIQKHPGCKKSEAKLEAPFNVKYLFVLYLWLIGLISGGGQGLLRINHVMQLFYSHIADIVVSNNNHLQLKWLM